MYPCNASLPIEAEIVRRVQESRHIFSLYLRFTVDKNLDFIPGQFNMLYLFGVGEVPISIVSDPEEKQSFQHTIRAVGRVTNAMAQLKVGDRIGVRGPFGQGWPLAKAEHKNMVIITGGLGCAPTVSIINYIATRRERFGKLSILQGVKHSDDFIFQDRYQTWQALPNTEVFILANISTASWPWLTGHVTEQIKNLNLESDNTMVMMCGPNVMMQAAVEAMQKKGVPEEQMYLSLERNMECGIGLCGHCQLGGKFICKDGPIFAYSEIKSLFNVPGF